MNPKKRCTAEAALKDKWVQYLAPNASGSNLSTAAFANLKKFRGMNRLKRAALTMIAGQMTDYSLKELKDMFKALDKDGDGTISIQEMREGMEKGNLKIPEDLKLLMEQVDSDGSGEIDYTEFLAATIDQRHYMQEDVCWSAFRAFDLDGDGKITKEELAQVMNGGEAGSVEEALGKSMKEIEQLIAENDTDGDGELDFDEFMSLMRMDKKEPVSPK